MDKTEVIDKMADRTNFTRDEAKEAIDAFIEVVIEGVAKSGSVDFLEFGRFKVNKKKARTGRNPQTGEPISISTSNEVLFLPSRNFQDAINQ